MDKVDYRLVQKDLYTPPKTPVLVDVPEFLFLQIDGQGDPNTAPAYQEAVSALFSLSYALKFAIKKSGGPDYAVMPLEGLWWVEDLAKLDMNDKSNWFWTMMIRQPPEVTPELFQKFAAEVEKKKGLPAVRQIRRQTFAEGRCAQIMHIGPYSAEMPTVERLHQFVRGQGLELTGRHHEIYLGDPLKTAPEKLRTVLRNPVSQA